MKCHWCSKNEITVSKYIRLGEATGILSNKNNNYKKYHFCSNKCLNNFLETDNYTVVEYYGLTKEEDEYFIKKLREENPPPERSYLLERIEKEVYEKRKLKEKEEKEEAYKKFKPKFIIFSIFSIIINLTIPISYALYREHGFFNALFIQYIIIYFISILHQFILRIFYELLLGKYDKYEYKEIKNYEFFIFQREIEWSDDIFLFPLPRFYSFYCFIRNLLICYLIWIIF